MKYGRYSIKSIAKASPLTPKKENAAGKRQQLSGRKDSIADITDPPVVIATLDSFISLLLYFAVEFLCFGFKGLRLQLWRVCQCAELVHPEIRRRRFFIPLGVCAV